MGRRMNPLALRVGKLISWPSNVSHPLLSDYIRHVFQGFLVSEPGIRSSLTETWVNVTVFGDPNKLGKHPLYNNPILNWDQSNLEPEKALGRLENRLLGLTTKNPKISNLLTKINENPKTSLVQLSASIYGINGALGLMNKRPIHLRINFIQNPVLDAEVLAQYVALLMSKRISLAGVYRELLKKMS